MKHAETLNESCRRTLSRVPWTAVVSAALSDFQLWVTDSDPTLFCTSFPGALSFMSSELSQLFGSLVSASRCSPASCSGLRAGAVPSASGVDAQQVSVAPMVPRSVKTPLHVTARHAGAWSGRRETAARTMVAG